MELGLRRAVGAEVLARLPAVRAQDALSKGVGVAGPARVIRIFGQLAAAVRKLCQRTRSVPHNSMSNTHSFAPARPIAVSNERPQLYCNSTSREMLLLRRQSRRWDIAEVQAMKILVGQIVWRRQEPEPEAATPPAQTPLPFPQASEFIGGPYREGLIYYIHAPTWFSCPFMTSSITECLRAVISRGMLNSIPLCCLCFVIVTPSSLT